MEDVKKIQIQIPEKYVSERNSANGVFYQVKFPNGMNADGTDLSACYFTINTAKILDGRAELELKEDKEIKLYRSEKDEQGVWTNSEVSKIKATELKKVIQDNFRTAAFLVNKQFVHDWSFTDEKTNEEIKKVDVTIPKGVELNGKDLGGYRFVCSPKALANVDGKENLQRVTFYSFYNIVAKKEMGEMVDGSWQPQLDDKGEKIVDTVRISAKDLSAAYEAVFEKWKVQAQENDKAKETTPVQEEQDFRDVSETEDKPPFDEIPQEEVPGRSR